MKCQLLLVSLCAVLLSSCATPRYNYQPVVQETSQPPIGSVNTANVGDEMLSQGSYSEQDAIRLSKSIRFGMLGEYTLTPGYYVKTGEDAQSSYYQPAQGTDGGHVQKLAIADPWESIQLTKDGTKISVVTVFHMKVSEPADGVTKTAYHIFSPDSFQQTLIYSGEVGDKIKIGYREFSNDAARPAFNNDVDYDLSQSKIIGYKGARLEILEATNDHIKYKVISNFNSAQR
jgi:hypothetical protein